MITKRRLISLACTGSLAAILPDALHTAAAETASRMLVGFGVGGAIDVIARLLVEGSTGARWNCACTAPSGRSPGWRTGPRSPPVARRRPR